MGRDSGLVRILIDGILDKNYIVRQAAAHVYETKMHEDKWKIVPPAETRISEKDIRSHWDGTRSTHTPRS